MSDQDAELEAFSKFIVALEPWLREVVLIGGWADGLYRLDPRARTLDYLPLTTLDGDVAVPPKTQEGRIEHAEASSVTRTTLQFKMRKLGISRVYSGRVSGNGVAARCLGKQNSSGRSVSINLFCDGTVKPFI